MKKIGNVCHYMLDEKLLGDSPIVVSGGMGLDVTFEIDMLRDYNATIYAYDFIPVSINICKAMIGSDFISSKRFILVEKGLSDKKEISVFLTENIDAISSSEYRSHPNNTNKYINVKCHSIEDVFIYNKINHIDVLKLNIEGSESELLFNAKDEDLKKIRQICVSLHGGLLRDIKIKDEDVVKRLKGAGFEINNITENQVFSFVRIG